jgi:hypothetical protein
LNHSKKEDDISALNPEDEEKEEEALKEEILEKALTEQWPPPDQIDHNHVGIIDRFAKKMGNRQKVRMRNLLSPTVHKKVNCFFWILLMI